MKIITPVLFFLASAVAASGSEHWIATWLASPSAPVPNSAAVTERRLVYDHQTLRQIAHVSVGGSSIRIKISNVFGTAPLKIGAIHAALQAQGASIVKGSDRVVTFSGRESVVILPGAMLLSDPIDLTVPNAGNLAISLFLPDSVTASALHYFNQQKTYIVSGDVPGTETMENPAVTLSWAYLTAIDVMAPSSIATIVTFGDSITDGYGSTDDANRRWPDVLATRLLLHSGRRRFAVANAGLSGNRVLHDAPKRIEFGPSALARFDRDVLAQAGVADLIVLEGINDIAHPGGDAPLSEMITAQDLIAGYQQLINRAHEKDIKVIGCTILPVGRIDERELIRTTANEWIRHSGAFDGVVDFDRVMRDPGRSIQLNPAYDCGDHVHPNDAGYQVMANAIDLSLFR